MIIIGITGKVCAGKGIFKDLIKRLAGYDTFSLSDVLRSELKKSGDELTRDNLINLGNKLRKEHGYGILAKILVEEVEPPAIIDSIRHPSEVDELRNAYREKFILVNIGSTPRNRFERMRKRGREKDSKTWEEFTELLEIENGKGQGGFGQLLNECEAMADYTITNNGSMGEFESKVQNFFNSLNQ